MVIDFQKIWILQLLHEFNKEIINVANWEGYKQKEEWGGEIYSFHNLIANATSKSMGMFLSIPV